MKIENIYENKARFFALYWGVKCLRNEFLNDNIPPHKVDVSTCRGLPQQYLELTPLSQITDEDAVAVYNLAGVDEAHVKFYELNDSDFIKQGKNLAQSALYSNGTRFTGLYRMSLVADYLRSKGYALPWMGMSVEDLVSYGWVKIKS